MKTDRDNLRDLFRGYVDSKRPPCRRNCPVFRVMASSFEPSASIRDKTRIVDHISECSDCREEFMLLLELRKAEAEITEGESRHHPLLWQYACVLVGLGLALTSFFVLFQRKELSDVRRTPEVGILTLSPETGQTISGPIVFRWQRDPTAEYYVLELFDGALLPVWTSDKIQDIQVNLPPDVGLRLQSGRPYYWMITAYSQGTVIEESRLTRFTIDPQKYPGP